LRKTKQSKWNYHYCAIVGTADH